MLGEVWESFFIEGRKVGFLRRVTSVSENPNILVSTLTIMYGRARFQHTFSFYDAAGYSPHSYLFDTNDGAPVHVQFAGDEMICQVDEDIFTEKVPADARPSYGYFPLVITMSFEKGAKLSFTSIEDASCVVQGPTELVSHGWEDVVIEGQSLRLWLVGEYTNGQLGNRYWLDEHRRIRQSHWQGAKSIWVPSQEEALSNLPTELVEYAKSAFDVSNNSDWTAEIIKWLDQKE
ncbi:MAG: hypothetical protein DWQ04_18390 [Chloroflexi bacterium]|nr:MAG: hypothetical protein DWQ04_18390 [Chloroflexota bacterium]